MFYDSNLAAAATAGASKLFYGVLLRFFWSSSAHTYTELVSYYYLVSSSPRKRSLLPQQKIGTSIAELPI